MRFGILCNGPYFQQWQLDSVRLLVSAGHSCALLIENANPVPVQGFRDKLIQYPYSKLFYRLWFRFLMKPEAKKDAGFAAVLTGIPGISCFTTRRGFSDYLSEADVDTIRSYELDFILRYGFGILKGGILDAAKYGVWSYHHDDERKYRGVPTGFWEIMFGDPVNAAILQRLTSKLDSGVILHKGWFATINHSWEANLNKLLLSTTEWPLQVCRKIESGNTEFLKVTNSPGPAIYRLPGNLKMLRFFLQLSYNKLRFHYRDLFLTEKWNVGIIPLPVEKLLLKGEFTIPEPQWLNIRSEKSMYHADSFSLVKDGLIHILCEEYNYRSARGFIISLQLDRHTFRIVSKTTALEKEYHLAYPFLFESEGSYFCIPENSAGGDTDLYRYDTSQGKLIFEQTLISGMRAVDPSLFYYEGKWWLFFTDKISTNERLHIWYAENMRGPYLSHANNPVKIDIRSARPGGNLFVSGGKLFRPAQDCSERSGRRICINQVLKLSTTDFVEEEFTILNPATGSRYPDGMHTFSVTDGVVVVDGKRECFIWAAFAGKLSKKSVKLFKGRI
ncbi:MAG: hypothetical protein WCR72_05635 [Bacteroidota bacterium]